MPAPVSYFDFHEGSGTTTTSTVGGYVLTAASSGAAGWITGGTQGTFNGPCGPSAGPLTSWTIVFETTMAAAGFGRNFGRDLADDDPWFNFDGSRLPGPYPPGGVGTVPIPANQRSTVAYVFSPTDSKTYVDGVLSGTFGDTHTSTLQNIVINGSSGPNLTIHTLRLWNVALTAGEVAALSAPPGTAVAAPLSGAGALTAATTQRFPVSASLAGVGLLTGGVTAAAQIPVTVSLAGAGTLTARAIQYVPPPVSPDFPPSFIPARWGIGHAKYVSGMSEDGYPGSPAFEDEVVQPSFGWYSLASEVPLGNEDYTQRVITSLVVGVPDTAPYKPGDKVVLTARPIPLADLIAPVDGEDFVVSEDVRDYTTGPWDRGPGGVIIVERVTG